LSFRVFRVLIWFPNSVWEPTSRNSVSRLPHTCRVDGRETEFRGVRSQTEFGNEDRGKKIFDSMNSFLFFVFFVFFVCFVVVDLVEGT
jgi:hypothetical protein